MNTPVTHRFVALVLSVVLSLGLFETVSGFAAPGTPGSCSCERTCRRPSAADKRQAASGKRHGPALAARPGVRPGFVDGSGTTSNPAHDLRPIPA
ncbi:MAG: hypothetical protein R3E78_03225 [Burkholderiaceae bacterium]